MSLREAYIESLKNRIAPLIALSTPENISTDYHDEFSYNTDVDVDVTVKFLPGQIQSGVVQYPGELLISIKEKYYSTVIEAFNEFAINNNEHVVTFTLDGTSATYREYYLTPNVIGAFQNGGIENYVSISISTSLISFNNVCGLDSLELGLVDLNTNLETIKWLTFNVSYAADNNSSGSINGDTIVKQVASTAGINYTFTFVPKLGDESQYVKTINTLLRQLISGKTISNGSLINANINQHYKLAITMGYLFPAGEAVNIDCILVSGTYSQEANGLPIVQVTFARGD